MRHIFHLNNIMYLHGQIKANGVIKVCHILGEKVFRTDTRRSLLERPGEKSAKKRS